ncbi:hypothetical protein BgiBS90_020868 [Biomphalaria glabrata]|nr:hypothetical protein BgiBS90_020868 [Biomphalaria glabrata]
MTAESVLSLLHEFLERVNPFQENFLKPTPRVRCRICKCRYESATEKTQTALSATTQTWKAMMDATPLQQHHHHLPITFFLPRNRADDKGRPLLSTEKNV